MINLSKTFSNSYNYRSIDSSASKIDDLLALVYSYKLLDSLNVPLLRPAGTVLSMFTEIPFKNESVYVGQLDPIVFGKPWNFQFGSLITSAVVSDIIESLKEDKE